MLEQLLTDLVSGENPISWATLVIAALYGAKLGLNLYQNHSDWKRKVDQDRDKWERENDQSQSVWYRAMIEKSLEQHGAVVQTVQRLADSMLLIMEKSDHHSECFKRQDEVLARIESHVAKTVAKRRTDFSKDDSHVKPTT